MQAVQFLNSIATVKSQPFFRRLGVTRNDSSDSSNVIKPSKSIAEGNTKDDEILNRLRKLKEDSKGATPGSSEEEIARRLQKIKGEMPSTSDAELHKRLANLRGVPVSAVQSKPVLPAPDLRTEQEQADDLMKQYMDQTKMDSKYKEEFDGLVSDIESRLGKLKRSAGPAAAGSVKASEKEESEDEEETVRKIIAKVKAEASLQIEELPPSSNDELPFCEICNEDAKMRCLGCRYLFCTRCFMEHKDDDDGCNRYEPYSPPKGCQY